MATLTIRDSLDSIRAILAELMQGPDPGSPWILNAGDEGLLANLRRLTPAQAQRTPIEGRASIAGHANHVLFHLGLLNRAMKGENSFAGADWKGSWILGEIDAKAWREMIDGIERAADAYRSHLSEPFEYDPIALTGSLASVVHIGYHFGAIRQLMGLV